MDNKLAKISASPHPLKHVDAIIRSLESEYFNLLRDVQRRNAPPCGFLSFPFAHSTISF